MMFQKMLLEVPDNDNDMIMVARVDLHSPKLTKPLNIGHPQRQLVFQPCIFRGCISFREAICCKVDGVLVFAFDPS